MTKTVVPVFFSTDDRYISLLEVAIASIVKHASKDNEYRLYILNDGLTETNQEILRAYERDNVSIIFQDVTENIEKINSESSLRLRDYYSKTIYYRLFIPELFEEYDKGIYLDCDIVLVDDIAKLYNESIGDCLVGATVDEVAKAQEVFCTYVKVNAGVEAWNYFNSGMLLMNLKEFRKMNLCQNFLDVFNKFEFGTVAPDQDFLNYVCRDRVHYLQLGWNKTPAKNEEFNDKDLHLIHYNMFEKPTRYEDLPYQEYFWEIARDTISYGKLQEQLASVTDADREEDLKGAAQMLVTAQEIIDSGKTLKMAAEALGL